MLLSLGCATGFGIGIARHAAVRLAVPSHRRGSSGHAAAVVIVHMLLLGASAAAGTAHSGARATRLLFGDCCENMNTFVQSHKCEIVHILALIRMSGCKFIYKKEHEEYAQMNGRKLNKWKRVAKRCNRLILLHLKATQLMMHKCAPFNRLLLT